MKKHLGDRSERVLSLFKTPRGFKIINNFMQAVE